MRNLYFITVVIIFSGVNLFAQTGSITNVQVDQRTDETGLVDVYFDLEGPNEGYLIKLKISFDGGQNYWQVIPTTITGDIGPINPGTGKHIVWDPNQQFPQRYSPQTKLKIIAYILEIMNPCSGSPTVTDFDGNIYYTVQIGDQCWMNENLNTNHSPTGVNITRYCYGNDPGYCELYGGLYDWSTLMNGASSSNGNPSGVQGICPNGWHVPSDAEWTELTDYLINNYVDINAGNVGNKLKSCRQVNSPIGGDCNTSVHPRWDSYTGVYGTNDFGFSSLPGGYHDGYSGTFTSLGAVGYWWSSTVNSSTHAWARYMYRDLGSVNRGYNVKPYGFSIRCIKD